MFNHIYLTINRNTKNLFLIKHFHQARSFLMDMIHQNVVQFVRQVKQKHLNKFVSKELFYTACTFLDGYDPSK